MENNFFEIGEIVRPKGLDGTVKVRLFSQDEQNLTAQKSFLVAAPKGALAPRSFTVKKSYVYDEALYITFNEITSPKAAESLKWHKICLPREKASPLKKGEFYQADLIGLEMFDEAGDKIGKITEINNYGAAPVLTVKTRRGEYLCPLVPDLIIKVNAQAGSITVNGKRYGEVATI